MLRSQELDKGPDTIPNKDCELTSVSVHEWCNEAEDWDRYGNYKVYTAHCFGFICIGLVEPVI